MWEDNFGVQVLAVLELMSWVSVLYNECCRTPSQAPSLAQDESPPRKLTISQGGWDYQLSSAGGQFWRVGGGCVALRLPHKVCLSRNLRDDTGQEHFQGGDRLPTMGSGLAAAAWQVLEKGQGMRAQTPPCVALTVVLGGSWMQNTKWVRQVRRQWAKQDHFSREGAVWSSGKSGLSGLGRREDGQVDRRGSGEF